MRVEVLGHARAGLHGFGMRGVHGVGFRGARFQSSRAVTVRHGV